MDENLLKKSYKEQMDLIDKYIELGKDTNVYSIIINPSEKTVTRILIEIKQYLEIGIIRQQKTKNVIFTKDECIDVNDNKGINLVKRIKT